MTTRREHDLLGDRDVPAEAYYGVHTLRAVENFPITGTPISIYPDLIAALASIKQAAAQSNHELGLLDAKLRRRHRRGLRGSPRRRAARPVRRRRDPGRRRHVDQHERERGDREPRAGAARPRQGRLRIPASERARQHEPEHQRRLSDGAQARGLRRHHAAGRSDGGAARGVRAQGRRVRRRPQDGPHPVAGRGADDAGPGILDLRGDARRGRAAAAGSGAADPRDQPGRDRDRHRHQLRIPDYAALVCRHLRSVTGIPVVTAPNLVEATQDCGAFVQLSGVLKRVAVKLSKTCNDLRLLSSGPRAGLGEINLPPMQAGSTIMPGKVNPVIPEVVNQVAFEVIGNDVTVSFAAEAGQLQLNAFEPIIAHSLFKSVKHLRAGCLTLAAKCVNGITANREHLRRGVENSIGIVTALNPYIGYANATEIAQEALATGAERLRARAGQEAADARAARPDPAAGSADPAARVCGDLGRRPAAGGERRAEGDRVRAVPLNSPTRFS